MNRTRKPLKADVAYERLRELLVTLKIDPGMPIDEQDLMERIGVGRTPVREAVQRLVHEGLIVQTPRRGSWVSPLTIPDLQHMLEARRLVEPPVARIAAMRITDQQVDRIRADLDEAGALITAGDNERCVFLDQRFHSALAAATGNPHLTRLVEQTNHGLLRYWYVSFVRVGNLGPTFDHHWTLLQAVERGQVDEAERLMHAHLDMFRDRIRDVVANLEPRVDVTAHHLV